MDGRSRPVGSRDPGVCGGARARDAGSAPAPRARRRAVPGAVFLGILALAAAVRLYRLDADPPHPLLPGYEQDQTAYRDEAAKAHEVRKRLRFGTWRPNPADEYTIWRADSPVWVYGQLAWASLFGLTYPSLRAQVALYALGTVALVGVIAATAYGPAAAVTASALFGFNLAYVHLSRLALMEPVVLFYLLAAVAVLTRLARRPRAGPWHVVAAGLLALAACLTKPTALPYAGLLAAWSLAVIWRREAVASPGRPQPPGRGAEGRAWGATVVAGTVVLGLLAASPAYRRALAYHLADYLGSPWGPPGVEGSGVGAAGASWLEQLVAMVGRLAPVELALAGGELLWVGLAAWGNGRVGVSRRPAPGAESASRGLTGTPPAGPDRAAGTLAPDSLTAFLAAWLALTLAGNLAIASPALHLQLPALPAAALLAGAFARRLWAGAVWGTAGRAALGGVPGDVRRRPGGGVRAVATDSVPLAGGGRAGAGRADRRPTGGDRGRVRGAGDAGDPLRALLRATAGPERLPAHPAGSRDHPPARRAHRHGDGRARPRGAGAPVGGGEGGRAASLRGPPGPLRAGRGADRRGAARRRSPGGRRACPRTRGSVLRT